jgi:protein-S-isoprenylcysteine O-methyltransferase Ste14
MERTKGRRWSARIIELGILILLPILCHCLIPVMTVVPVPYAYLGAVPILLGLALMTWAASSFREAETGYELQRSSPALMTSGPFGISRNPMYLGMLLWLVGLAALLGSLSAFFFPLLLFLLANFLLIPTEEKRMDKLFGEQYVEYRQHVRRWL